MKPQTPSLIFRLRFGSKGEVMITLIVIPAALLFMYCLLQTAFCFRYDCSIANMLKITIPFYLLAVFSFFIVLHNTVTPSGFGFVTFKFFLLSVIGFFVISLFFVLAARVIRVVCGGIQR